MYPCLQAPLFDPATTDAPSHYIVEFSHQDSSDSDTRNISATDPLMVNFTNLMKGTVYRARVVAFNVRMRGQNSDYVTVQTAIDCKFSTVLTIIPVWFFYLGM